MSRATPKTIAPESSFNLVLACLVVALILLPLSFGKPGMPAQLAPKEAATYLAAQSLVHDHDFVCTSGDLGRLFRDYPFAAAAIPLQSPDDWASARFAVPSIYPLLIAPLVLVFGGNGPLAFNTALLALMMVFAARRLRAENPASVALLFAVGFFALTPFFAYALMVQSDVFAAALGFFSLALSASPHDRRETDAVRTTFAAMTGACLLGIAVSEQPVLAALLLPIVYLRSTRPNNRAALTWCASFAASLAVAAGLNLALTGSPAPWLARATALPAIDGPTLALAGTTANEVSDTTYAASPDHPRLDLEPRRLGLDLVYSLIGRHSGILFYAPMAALAWFFGARTRRPGFWLTSAAVAGGVVVCIAWLPGAWQGGGQAIGNRYFLALYPSLVLMVGRIAPVAPMVATWALGGLTLGPLLFTTLGPAVPWPDSQTHARHRLLRELPLERTLLDSLDGFAPVFSGANVRWISRRDVTVRDGRQIFVHGALPVELWLEGRDPIEPIELELTSLAADNPVVIDDGGERHRFAFPASDGGEGQPTAVRATIRPRDCTRVQTRTGHQQVCRLLVHAQTGDWPKWRQLSDSRFLVGVAIDVLNDAEVVTSHLTRAP